MTFQQLNEYLVDLENQWDMTLIDDQQMDKEAAEAAIKWAAAARHRLTGGLYKYTGSSK